MSEKIHDKSESEIVNEQKEVPIDLRVSEAITAYYENLDESDPAHAPTDNETMTQSPFPQFCKEVKE